MYFAFNFVCTKLLDVLEFKPNPMELTTVDFDIVSCIYVSMTSRNVVMVFRIVIMP